mmetsp:Transcript_4732/g.14272  ORF Transcript_4732/g.14272 Transcript_4732/m.14272 type:complete len:289 (-) Transcript_4732:2076-2942(-)
MVLAKFPTALFRRRTLIADARRLALGTRWMRQATLERIARKEVTQITINQMLELGRNLTSSSLLQNARYVHEELPIRLAHRLVDIQKLPHFAVQGPFKKIYDIYVDAFDTLSSLPYVRDESDDENFTKILLRLIAESAHVVDALAVGLREAQRRASAIDARVDFDSFIDQLLMSRIGRRVLAEQHIQLHHPKSHAGSFIGVIDTECSTQQCLQKCVREASRICKIRYPRPSPSTARVIHEKTKGEASNNACARYGVSPEVDLDGGDPKISYIPHHQRSPCSLLTATHL